MKTIIAGSRSITDICKLEKAIHDCGWSLSSVICGGARGADELGRKWAIKHNIPCEIIPAKWEIHGKSAGFKRNYEMLRMCGALIALWDGRSKGTYHMIDIAKKSGIKVHIHYVSD